MKYFDVKSVEVRSFTPKINGPETEVHLFLNLTEKPPIVLRLKSREAAMKLIDALQKHTDSIWKEESIVEAEERDKRENNYPFG